jgi:hypothetical protein
MTNTTRASLDEVRSFHAKMMAAASNSIDERLERIFELVPRAAFLGPGPHGTSGAPQLSRNSVQMLSRSTSAASQVATEPFPALLQRGSAVYLGHLASEEKQRLVGSG